jgi:hypothetical protein
MGDSTFTLDSETLEVILKSLQEKGIAYENCDWISRQVNLRWDPERMQLVGENFRTARANEAHYHVTLVKQHDHDKGYDYRAPLSMEHDAGRSHAGDVALELRLHPSGRWMVHVGLEQAFTTDDQFNVVKRANRSSKDNEDQAVQRRPDADLSDVRFNNRRIGGKNVANHVTMPGWGPNLTMADFVDVYDFVRSLDGPGIIALDKAMAETPPEYAADMLEIHLQKRDRARVVKE